MKSFLVLIILSFSNLALAQWDNYFETRLDPRLAIAGKKCEGGELSGVSDKVCEIGQWIILMDDINECDESSCTDFSVVPFIAKLNKVNPVAQRVYAFYEIIPQDVMTSPRRKVVGRYWVRFDLNGEPIVLRRTTK